MNMKKMFSVFVFVLLATVVLVNVLGNKDDGEELMYNGKSYSDYFTELKQVNAPLELLKKYDSAQNTMEVKDPDGNALGTYQTSYTRTEEGDLLFVNVNKDADGNETVLMNGYKQGARPGAYYLVSGNQKFMTIYPAAEYELSVANNQALDMTLLGYTESVIELKEEQGELVIVTIAANEKNEEANRVTYYADPATLELHARDIQTYVDDELASQSLTEYAYDAPAITEYAAAEAVLDENTGCHLTITLITEDEQTEVQEFMVSKDTHVTFQSERKFKMYSDEELKKKVKSIDISGESAEVHVVLEPEEKEDEE